MTAENWNNVLYNVMVATQPIAALWCIAAFVIGNYILLNLFLAVLLENFGASSARQRRQSSSNDSMLLAAANAALVLDWMRELLSKSFVATLVCCHGNRVHVLHEDEDEGSAWRDNLPSPDPSGNASLRLQDHSHRPGSLSSHHNASRKRTESLKSDGQTRPTRTTSNRQEVSNMSEAQDEVSSLTGGNVMHPAALLNASAGKSVNLLLGAGSVGGRLYVDDAAAIEKTAVRMDSFMQRRQLKLHHQR
jgi:hypothetical protein